jgi:hypothetical protein
MPKINGSVKTKTCVKPKIAPSNHNGNGKAREVVKPISPLSNLCTQLQELQRQRVCNLKSRIMIENRLVATVATMDGYCTAMGDLERKNRFKEAKKIIERVSESVTESDSSDATPLIRTTLPAIKGFDDMVNGYEKEMEKIAKKLPVAKWVLHPAQRGFGFLTLAKIIGECGDLALYENPGKVWRRMGCAPYESRGHMRMGSTWRRSKPSLSAEEWEDFGYNSRRRSVAYLIGEGIVKQNGGGPYRRRYDIVKAKAAAEHPEWTECPKCKGSGKTSKRSNCSNCGGTGVVMMHCHLHAMLLATKYLLLHLWIEWNGESHDYVWQRTAEAKCAFV